VNDVALAMRWIGMETAALETRLAGLPRFADTLPMVAAAAPSHDAVCVADRAVERSRATLGRDLLRLRSHLAGARQDHAHLRRAQRRYLALRGQFSRLLGTVDVFSDALTQRAEHGIGVVLRGLDILATDGIRTRAPGYSPPPLVCYLDDSVPGGGGAIRRAFTLLPGGETNAVGLIKIPRERLLGLGLTSLLHEVGHQGVASLGLLPFYRALIQRGISRGDLDSFAGAWWSHKLSEVLPDLWAVAKLGITATLGLLGVLGRNDALTFHDRPDDPHPVPWLRAMTSARWGGLTMPHDTWSSLSRLWTTLYSPVRAPAAVRVLLQRLVPTIDVVLGLIAGARPDALGGMTLPEALAAGSVAPSVLLPDLPSKISDLKRGRAGDLSPCMSLAVVGLARHVGVLEAAEEHDLLDQQARAWARRDVCSSR
jgi:hypothetical protein